MVAGLNKEFKKISYEIYVASKQAERMPNFRSVAPASSPINFAQRNNKLTKNEEIFVF